MAGKPKIDIDFKLVIKLCNIFCTRDEITTIIGCSNDTLERRIKADYDGMTFAEFFDKHSADGKSSLRSAQMRLALKGNATMQIWLGKQHLDQREKTDNVNRTVGWDVEPEKDFEDDE